MKLTLLFGVAIFAVVLSMDSCRHPPPQPGAVYNIAASWGVCVEDLSGDRVDPQELDLMLAELSRVWRKEFPGTDPDGFFADYGPRVLMVDHLINCTHLEVGRWAGDVSLCEGLWPGDGPTIFIKKNPRGLQCTALVHELLHLLSADLGKGSDPKHKNKKVWGIETAVRARLTSLPGFSNCGKD